MVERPERRTDDWVDNYREEGPLRPAASQKELTPPQLSVLARSFPVPRGSTATGGWGFICSSSRVDRIHPTYGERHTSVRERNSHWNINYNGVSPCRRRRRRGSSDLALCDTTLTWWSLLVFNYFKWTTTEIVCFQGEKYDDSTFTGRFIPHQVKECEF